MIVTVTTVVVLLIGVLSLALAFYGGLLSVFITENLEGNEEAKHSSEQRYYLLGMIGIIVLFARILNVPLFFWMIQSLVPYCPGAMCSYGVINVGMPYSFIALVLKVVLPFIYGAWLVVEIANRKQPLLPFIRNLARSFILVLLPLVVIDSVIDVLFVSSIQPVYAPCCSSVYDVDPPFSPSALFGQQFGMMVLLLTIIIALSLIAVQWFEHRWKYLPQITLLLAAMSAVLYLVTLHDTLAPIVLGLANHHCPYCLFQEFPDTPIFAGLFWIGIAAAGWRVILERIWQQKQLPLENIYSLKDFLLKLSSLSILFSMVSLVSHLIVSL